MLIKKNIRHEEEHVSSDRYLITYSDLITLLLGLFVILYVTSQVDEEKYKEFSKAFSQYFKSTKEQVLQGGGGVLPGPKNSIPEPIMPNVAIKTLSEIKKETEQALKTYIKDGLLELKQTGEGLQVTLPEKLLFKSGKADIQYDGGTVLDSLANILRGVDKQFIIDGHTDSDPIKTFRYESNWHLSVGRALNVGYRLMSMGLPEQNTTIRGFGSQKPIATNSTFDGKAKNRRVELTITDLPKTGLPVSGSGGSGNNQKKSNK